MRELAAELAVQPLTVSKAHSLLKRERLLGRSGAGKTTLLETLLGLREPNTGQAPL